MALTRKHLKSMGLTEEQVDAIIDLHLEVKNDLEEQIKTYKADAQKLPTVQKELDDLKKGDGEDWKAKYDAEKAAHDKTKNDHAAKETAAKVKSAYRAMLKEAGVADKYLDTVIKATDMSSMKLDKDGKLEGAGDLAKSAKNEWADFIQTTTTKGANVPNPPGNTSGKMSKEDIAKIKDPTERRAAIMANSELFSNM